MGVRGQRRGRHPRPRAVRAFLLTTGLGASVGEVLLAPEPVVILGACGMASTVMGGYLLLHPLARVVVASNPVPMFPMAVPAALVLGVALAFLLRARGVPVLQAPQTPEAILAGTGAVQRRAQPRASGPARSRP